MISAADAAADPAADMTGGAEITIFEKTPGLTLPRDIIAANPLSNRFEENSRYHLSPGADVTRVLSTSASGASMEGEECLFCESSGF